MAELKCPHCGQAFTVDDTELGSIMKQIRDKEFEKDLSNQIFNLSKIAKWKYDCFKKSISVLWKGELISLAIFMIIYWVGKGTK